MFERHATSWLQVVFEMSILLPALTHWLGQRIQGLVHLTIRHFRQVVGLLTLQFPYLKKLQQTRKLLQFPFRHLHPRLHDWPGFMLQSMYQRTPPLLLQSPFPSYCVHFQYPPISVSDGHSFTSVSLQQNALHGCARQVSPDPQSSEGQSPHVQWLACASRKNIRCGETASTEASRAERTRKPRRGIPLLTVSDALDMTSAEVTTGPHPPNPISFALVRSVLRSYEIHAGRSAVSVSSSAHAENAVSASVIVATTKIAIARVSA